MSDLDDEDEEDVVVNGVDDAVVAGADAPKLGGAFEFLGASGSRILGERVDLSVDASSHRSVESIQLLGSAGLELDTVHAQLGVTGGAAS